MKKLVWHLTLILFAAIIMDGCKKSDSDESSSPDTPPITNPQPTGTTSREAVIQDYKTNYLGSEITNPGWTGSTASCNPGTIPASTCNAIIKRINYFRRMVGLNDNCMIDESKAAQEQQTALMMSANNMLSHYPTQSWSCYSDQGSAGASSSNLTLGIHSSPAITAFMQDDGGGNEPCGHRRWILHSPKTSFGCGSTNNSMALYVFGAAGNNKVPEYIAFPPKGYVPQQLVFNRWSFGIPGADFSSATVTMNGPSGSVTAPVISATAVGYGDNTIIWAPSGIDRYNSTDVTYSVTISNIKNAKQSSYTYNVTLIRP